MNRSINHDFKTHIEQESTSNRALIGATRHQIATIALVGVNGITCYWETEHRRPCNKKKPEL